MESDQQDEGRGDRSWHSFWPLLVIVAVLALVVYRIAPANLTLVPFKLLQVCVALYLSHRVDIAFFKDKPRDGDLERAAHDLARALVFLGVVLGLTLGI